MSYAPHARSKSLSLHLPRSTSTPFLARSNSFPPMAIFKPLPPPPPPFPVDIIPVPSVPDHLQRETARRYHALSELLSTELGYLCDLRTLVSVYLRLLPVLKNRSSLPLVYASSSNPTINYFSRPPSSQNASFRTQSHPHLDGGSSSGLVILAPSDCIPSTHTPVRTEKCTTRHLFSASDIDTITRNAEDILDFHERLIHQLRQVVSPFGMSMPLRPIGQQRHRNLPIDVHRAINAVSTVFIDHASSFQHYQSFCSGHSEAFELVRKVQHRYAAEWDAFELRCAAAIAEMRFSDVSEEWGTSSAFKRHFVDLYERRHSLSSLETLSGENIKVPILTASESGHTDSTNRKPRLMFMDYMIKPIQRVCRYPLLFDQLQDRTGLQRFNDGVPDISSAPRDCQDTVKTALWTMRAVASLVDEARRQQDLFAKSVQIVSRITQGLLTSVASHSRLPQPAFLPTFLSSLAPCHLSGSLDVIHYRSTNVARLGTVRAKYLGAFLFPGGFLVLVKVTKSKVYEPKHWFNLRGFELVDSNSDDVLLPSWFRLSSKAHMFEFAASCRREKEIWVDAIRHVIAAEAPWNDDPPSSLQTDFAPSLLEDVQFESISPLPTIQSIPELDDVDTTIPNSGEAPVPPPGTQQASHLRAESSGKSDVTTLHLVGHNRRSMTAPLPTPIPESNTFHLVRSTASAREQVDRGLLDIFSDKCLTARLHAHTHEEDLFEAQRVTHSFSRSSSALTMASAMSVAAKNRLTKRESVLVPRKKSFVEGNGTLSDTENCATFVHITVPKPVKKTQHPSKLKIVAMSKATSYEGDEGGNEFSLESPSPMSHCSSVSFATPATPLTNPPSLPSGKADSLQSHSEFLNVRRTDCVPKRSKSMIENVRGLFFLRTASPPAALTRESSARSSASNSSLLKWWSRESFRRRVRSVPDVAGEEMPSALTTRSLHVEAASRPVLATTARPHSQPDLYRHLPEIATEFGVEESHFQQKRNMFSRGPHRRWRASAKREEDSMSVPTRIRRHLSFLHRFTDGTRHYDDTPGNLHHDR